MATKNFSFPTFDEWLELYTNLDAGSVVDSMKVLHCWNKYRKWYALDLLTELMGFMNDGWTPSYSASYMQPDIYFTISYCIVEDDSILRWRSLSASAEYDLSGELFLFESEENTLHFLDYKGCGTSTIEQLNILFGIKE